MTNQQDLEDNIIEVDKFLLEKQEIDRKRKLINDQIKEIQKNKFMLLITIIYTIIFLLAVLFLLTLPTWIAYKIIFKH